MIHVEYAGFPIVLCSTPVILHLIDRLSGPCRYEKCFTFTESVFVLKDEPMKWRSEVMFFVAGKRYCFFQSLLNEKCM